MNFKKRLAALLLAKSYIEGEVTLTSGRKSSYYFDCKQTSLHPEGAHLIGTAFLEMLSGREVDAVAGMTLGADPLVSAVSVLSYAAGRPLPGLIIRKEAKGHGTGAYLEGLSNVPPGSKVALLEDVVTSGGTLITAAKRLTDAGLTVAAVLTILDREEGGAENLAREGLTLESIFTKSLLFEYAGKEA